VINERTTVAAAYALAQFSSDAGFAGPSPGLRNAAAIVWNLVNPVTGGVGSVLGSFPNGLETLTMREFNSLANMLASCVDDSTSLACLSLFRLATSPRGVPPNNTFEVALNIAHYPWQNSSTLFVQSRIATLYTPALLQAPDAWTLAITYEGNGHEFDGPGNMAIDKAGDVWVANNYEYGASPFVNVCGGLQLLKLTPDGRNVWTANSGAIELPCGNNQGKPFLGKASVAKLSRVGKTMKASVFTGGGITVPWGIAVDGDDNVWVANFGGQRLSDFCGAESSKCPEGMKTGDPISPETGYTSDALTRNTGVAIDPSGNVCRRTSG
jgi:hypothetical protein